MSTCGITTLRTINGDTNMEIVGIHGHQENGPGDCSNLRERPEGVVESSNQQTPQAGGIVIPLVAPPTVDADNISRLTNRGAIRGTRCKRLIKKLESGSGSGDQEFNHNDDASCKKRKTRRGKPKHRKLKPYTKPQSSYQARQRSRSIGRLIEKSTQPPAPYNTTQFLMEDHSDLPDLEEKLSKPTTTTTTTNDSELTTIQYEKPINLRTRDSSFSIDSDDEYYYSSPEDEEEFLSREFSSAYEDLHAERLNALTKTALIQEYVQLEAKLDLANKRLRSKNIQPDELIDTDMNKKFKLYQQKIDDLMLQNEQLRRENDNLRAKLRNNESSVDSESDSDSSSTTTTSSSSSESILEDIPASRTIGRCGNKNKNGRATNQEIDGLPT